MHMVRNVAPNKRMLCVSFRLPHGVAFSQQLKFIDQHVNGSVGTRDDANGTARGEDEGAAGPNKKPRKASHGSTQ